MLEEKSKVVTREELMMELWSTDEYVSDGTLTTIVSRLRAKLKANCNDDVIHTKREWGILSNDVVFEKESKDVPSAFDCHSCIQLIFWSAFCRCR